MVPPGKARAVVEPLCDLVGRGTCGAICRYTNNGMFYLSFHGGSDKNSLNNIHVYNDDGTPATPAKLLPQGDPQIAELRSFAFVNGLMVVNAFKKYSQLLQYTQS